MKHVIVVASLLFVSLLCGCDLFLPRRNLSVTAYPEGSGSTGTNNASLFHFGDFAIGYGTTSNSLLQKMIGVTLRTADSKFSFGTGYATRSSTSSDCPWFVIPITNETTDRTFSFVKMTDIEYKNSDGTVIHEETTLYVTGSVYARSGFYSNTCLAPGETGYFRNVEGADLYSAVTSVEFNLEYTEADLHAPDALVLATELTYTEDSFGAVLHTDFENFGTASGVVSTYSIYILMDSLSRPLGWGYLAYNLSPLSGEVLAGGQGSIKDISLSYDGSATYVLVLMNYRDADSTRSLDARAPRGQAGYTTEELLRICTARELQREREIRSR